MQTGAAQRRRNGGQVSSALRLGILLNPPYQQIPLASPTHLHLGTFRKAAFQSGLRFWSLSASCVHTDWTITPPPPTTQNCGYISAEGIPKCRRCVMAAPRIKRSLFKAPTVQQIHLCSSVTFGFLLQRRRSLRRSDGSRRETEGGVFTFWAKASVIV